LLSPAAFEPYVRFLDTVFAGRGHDRRAARAPLARAAGDGRHPARRDAFGGGAGSVRRAVHGVHGGRRASSSGDPAADEPARGAAIGLGESALVGEDDGLDTVAWLAVGSPTSDVIDTPPSAWSTRSVQTSRSSKEAP
jgi:hypothetical protein